jgi:two-component system OmpR family sensor kinase
LEDLFIRLDKERAKLLFSNLLSNAIKYSLPNKRISLTLTKESFIIQDEGVGIAKEKHEKIFDLYERASQQAGGFGVGLSIVKQICDESNIKIEVDSKLNQGTAFRFSW